MTDHDITIRQNPYFRNAERPMYELGYLLRKMPDGLSPRELSADTHMVAEAARQHASNGISAAFSSIQAIGQLLAVAAGNDEAEIPQICQMDLGYLVQNLASEGQLMVEVESHMSYLLSADPAKVIDLCKRAAA